MSVQTVTDMRTFEGALGECYCHLFVYKGDRCVADRARCGVPRAEQQHNAPIWPLGSTLPTYCPACGHRYCPECLRRRLS